MLCPNHRIKLCGCVRQIIQILIKLRCQQIFRVCFFYIIMILTKIDIIHILPQNQSVRVRLGSHKGFSEWELIREPCLIVVTKFTVFKRFYRENRFLRQIPVLLLRECLLGHDGA